jgi:hypothetical protein
MLYNSLRVINDTRAEKYRCCDVVELEEKYDVYGLLPSSRIYLTKYKVEE